MHYQAEFIGCRQMHQHTKGMLTVIQWSGCCKAGLLGWALWLSAAVGFLCLLKWHEIAVGHRSSKKQAKAEKCRAVC